MGSLPPLARRAAWLGLIALLCAAFFSDGVHHADEHYQILEFAGWKLGITPESDLPWEFPARMRPALQPAMVVWAHHLLRPFGEVDPFLAVTLMRLVTALLSFVAAVLLLRGQLRDNPSLSDPRWLGLYLFLAFFLWFAVYCGVRFSSEGFSAALFAMGFATVAHPRSHSGALRLLLAGLLLGLAVVARFQMGLMVIGLLAWALVLARLPLAWLVALAAGCAIGFGAGSLIDRWFYGEWVFTAWNYIDLNILHGKAASFGTEPWWHYFAALFERMAPPFSLLFLVPPLLYFAFRRRDALTWSVVPFVLAHMVIGHKEYRFMFPVLPLLPALVVGGLGVMQERGWLTSLRPRARRILRGAFLLVHVPLLVVVLFKPAQDDIGFYEELYRIARPGDVLLHADDDPYRQGTPVWYGRPKGLVIRSLHATGEPHEGRLLFASRERDPRFPAGTSATLLYTSLPEWLLRFNVGGWADRSAVWRLWRIDALGPGSQVPPVSDH